MHRPSVLALAPAKLNLALAVGPRRDDGYHPVCSWMVTVDLYDGFLLTRLPPDRLSRYAILWHADARRRGEIDWSITRDLAVRAHLALEEHTGRRLPVQLKLEKRIPVGGGLGGGSSDAAAMLVALNALFALDLSRDELAGIGASLGADVPFLVHGGSAVVHGIGERVDRHDTAPDLHFVLVLPDAACDTAGVYERFDVAASRPWRPEAVRGLAGGPPCPESLFNDLAEAAVAEAPILAGHLDQVHALAERRPLVSGSGSTLFVLCDDPLHAEHLASAIDRECGVPAIAARVTSPGIDLQRGDAPPASRATEGRGTIDAFGGGHPLDEAGERG